MRPSHFFLNSRIFKIKSSTTEGSASVLVSPNVSSSPLAIFLNIRLMILPLLVMGSAGVINIISGDAKGPIAVRTAMRRLFINSSRFVVPELSRSVSSTVNVAKQHNPCPLTS
eukprot:CAMPEP_0171307488 /NCGR_PEP_ID=MMETSP0816-20121228/17502_1 /TAXON_ID=420281 /ORGANISM="Proboscia inermis, Strain CCAP1064/1" /LENGTH=112 /DNA_ID=CAMNT_0011789675 /DNA_START=796 /DNA_END=1134 /DNA_ORIENTATION=+